MDISRKWLADYVALDCDDAVLCHKLTMAGIEVEHVEKNSTVSDIVYQLIGGIRSGMGYCGAKDLETLRATSEFIKITNAALRESHPHDISITKEAPNYSPMD